MKRLLDDYRFDDRLRYEAHTLHYLPEQGEEMVIGNIMGAAVLCALLADTDEGDARDIALDDEAQRELFFERYEREMRRDNGGLFNTEVEALSDAYIELTDSDALIQICRNDRLFDLAVGLVVDYMKRLVMERVRAHIYDAATWCMPFAQWLFNAGWVETQRQQLLAIDWTDAAQVYALAQKLQAGNEPEPMKPMFLFEGEDAEQLMSEYFRWLWTQVKAQAAMQPDAAVQLARLKTDVLEQETNWDFIKPELKQLAPEHINLFRKWMTQWTDFITRKMNDNPQSTFPTPVKTPKVKQVLFADNVLSCPPENNYVKACEYIEDRCRYDVPFHTYYNSHTRVDFCKQLTAIFGWYVDPGFLGRRINYRKNNKK